MLDSPQVYEWTGPTGVKFVQEKSASGTYYHKETPQAVRDILDNAIDTGQRLRLWTGDIETGKAWHEEYDVLGRIGRSTGRIWIPLIIANSRSLGGPAILDQCIIAIADRPGNFLYKHPTLHLGTWRTGKAISKGYLEASFCDGELVGQFQKPGQAARHCAFMTGDRFAK